MISHFETSKMTYLCFSENYEQLAIQTNDDENSSTLAQIHIQACTKVKIDSEVVKKALRESFTAKTIIQISERTLSTRKRSLGDTPTSVAPKRIANGDSRKRKAPEATQAATSKKAKPENVPPSSPPPIEMSKTQFNKTGYSVLGNTKSPT